MAVTFVAPHSVNARPRRLPHGADLSCGTGRPTCPRPTLVDGHPVVDLPPGRPCRRAIGPQPRCSRRCRRYVLHPLPPRLCFVACGSRTSSSSGRRSLAPAPGLNAITGETGAGKTILAQAIGLLLGAKGDVAAVGPRRERGLRRGRARPARRASWRTTSSPASPSSRPEDEPGLVLARRVFADGRTRAYAWGRAVAREDLAAAAERLIAMSGPVRAAPSAVRRTSSTCSTPSSAPDSSGGA